MLESYRNELELFNLQCWALTCESFLKNRNGYGYISTLAILEIMNLYILNKYESCSTNQFKKTSKGCKLKNARSFRLWSVKVKISYSEFVNTKNEIDAVKGEDKFTSLTWS